MIYVIIIIMAVLCGILYHDLDLKDLILVVCLMILLSIYTLFMYKDCIKNNNIKYFEKGYWEGANAMYEYRNSNPKLLNVRLKKLKKEL